MQPVASPPRIQIRPAGPGDADRLEAWRAEPSIGRFQPLGAVSAARMRAELASLRSDGLYLGQGEKFQWIVLADGRAAGWITLVITNWDHGLAEFGYAMSTGFQRRGLMAPALELLLAELFLNTRIERLEARCAVANEASVKLLERLGFRREGTLRGYFELAGSRVDNYLYAMLRDDYLRLKVRREQPDTLVNPASSSD